MDETIVPESHLRAGAFEVNDRVYVIFIVEKEIQCEGHVQAIHLDDNTVDVLFDNRETHNIPCNYVFKAGGLPPIVIYTVDPTIHNEALKQAVQIFNNSTELKTLWNSCAENRRRYGIIYNKEMEGLQCVSSDMPKDVCFAVYTGEISMYKDDSQRLRHLLSVGKKSKSQRLDPYNFNNYRISLGSWGDEEEYELFITANRRDERLPKAARAEFLNHSCNQGGNCVLKLMKGVGGMPYCLVYSKRSITKGEQLTYNYGGSITRDFEECKKIAAQLSKQGYPAEAKHCLCRERCKNGFIELKNEYPNPIVDSGSDEEKDDSDYDVRGLFIQHGGKRRRAGKKGHVTATGYPVQLST